MPDETPEQPKNQEEEFSYQEFRHNVEKDATRIVGNEAPERIFSNIYDRFDEIKEEATGFIDNFLGTIKTDRQFIEEERHKLRQDVEDISKEMSRTENELSNPNPDYDVFFKIEDEFRGFSNRLNLFYRYAEEKEERKQLKDLIFQLGIVKNFSEVAPLLNENSLPLVGLNSLDISVYDLPKGANLKEEAYVALTKEIDSILQKWLEEPGFSINMDEVPEEFKEKFERFLQYTDAIGEPFPEGIAGKPLDRLFPDDLKETDEYKWFRYLCNLRYLLRPEDSYLTALYEERRF